jgi:hypothetical protein
MSGVATADYLKIGDPPDVDKAGVPPGPPSPADPSCWLASAANMLGAAGYGDPNQIYGALTGHFGTATPGLQGDALNWYISLHPGFDYRVVTEYGRTSLWDSHWTPMFIAEQLRICQFVGIGIWPTMTGASDGHALTVWGDDGNPAAPAYALVTDSDRDLGGLDVNLYIWTLYANALGPGLDLYAIDYYPAPGYLEYVVTLCPIPEPSAIGLAGVGFAMLLVVGFTTRSRWRKPRGTRPNGAPTQHSV